MMRGERKLAQQAMSRRALTLFCNLMERSANGEVNMNGSRRKSYHGVRLNSEGPKHSEVGGCLQNPKWAFGGKLTDENAWRASAVGQITLMNDWWRLTFGGTKVRQVALGWT
ncbi:MAG: hypothetical protein ACTS40_01720 [Candidatus Hodgkinia cicadicola]